VDLGRDVVICEVTVTNSEDYTLLLLGTSLEKITPNIFRVIHDESKLTYNGPFFNSHVISSHSKGIILKADQSIRTSVELSTVYAMREKGGYTISLSCKIYFMKEGDHDVTHPITFMMHGNISESARMTTGEKNRAERCQIRNESLMRSTSLTDVVVTSGSGGSPSIADAEATELTWTIA